MIEQKAFMFSYDEVDNNRYDDLRKKDICSFMYWYCNCCCDEEDWRKKGLSVVSGEKTSTLNSLSLPSGAFRASLLPSGWDSAPHQSKQRKNANLNALIMMAVKSVQR